MPKVPSSVGAHQSRILAAIQSSTETEQADIERATLRRRRSAEPAQSAPSTPIL